MAAVTECEKGGTCWLCLFCDFLVPGDRRIRVHTIGLPVTSNVSQVYSGLDEQAIVSLVAKMGESVVAGWSGHCYYIIAVGMYWLFIGRSMLF